MAHTTWKHLTDRHLLSQNECAKLLGMHKSALCTLRQRQIDTFPDYLAVVGQTRMYDRDEVVSWYAAHKGMTYEPSADGEASRLWLRA